MSKASLWVREYHLVLALSLLLGSVVFLAIGLWATILLLLTVQPTVSLILVLLGGWFVLGGIAASAITLWQIICSPQKVTSGVRRLQWLLGRHNHHHCDHQLNLQLSMGRKRRCTRINLHRLVCRCDAICLLGAC